jgi:hypothetical protein
MNDSFVLSRWSKGRTFLNERGWSRSSMSPYFSKTVFALRPYAIDDSPRLNGKIGK